MKEPNTGWTDEEDQKLLEAAADARRERLPLKTAFDAIASETQRRPNSVRNHYYTCLKAQAQSEPAFLPFSADETDRLLKTVLLAQANGQSVRACTLGMANGDTRLMLRYQNKYRAMLKAQPEKVKTLCAALNKQGYAVPDPYTRDRTVPHVGRPPKLRQSQEHRIRALLDALYRDLVALSKEESVG